MHPHYAETKKKNKQAGNSVYEKKMTWVLKNLEFSIKKAKIMAASADVFGNILSNQRQSSQTFRWKKAQRLRIMERM